MAPDLPQALLAGGPTTRPPWKAALSPAPSPVQVFPGECLAQGPEGWAGRTPHPSLASLASRAGTAGGPGLPRTRESSEPAATQSLIVGLHPAGRHVTAEGGRCGRRPGPAACLLAGALQTCT